MISLNLMQKGIPNHSVLRFILESEDTEFCNEILGEIMQCESNPEQEGTGTVHTIRFMDGLVVKILQKGNDYTLLWCS